MIDKIKNAMLTLFRNITEELTDLEKTELVPLMLHILNDTSENTRIKNSLLRSWLLHHGFTVSEVRIRKMVNYIRVMNLAKPKVLIGAANGYFLTADIGKVDEQIESLEGRIDSMKAAIDSIKAQKQNLIYQNT